MSTAFESTSALLEIADVKDARYRLENIYANYDKSLYEPLADMLELLSVTKSGRFAKGLEDVSKDIWIEYNRESVRELPNRFTRSILIYARQYGFTCDENIVFASPLKGSDFGHYIKTGKLWKDSIALGHGEFSHSYQWLTAGKVLGWGMKTAEIFKNVAAKKGAMSAIEVWDKNDEQKIVKMKLPLWGYLVDCLDYKNWYNMTKQDKDFPILNAFTDGTYRSPNQVSKLVKNNNWFISFYEHHRFNKLVVAQETGQKILRQRGGIDKPFDEKLTGGEKEKFKAVEGVKLERRIHYVAEVPNPSEVGKTAMKPGWASPRQGVFERTTTAPSQADSPSIAEEKVKAKAKDQVPIDFHGIKGTVPKTITG